MEEKIFQSAQALQKFAETFAAYLRAGDTLWLTGDLGSGKTTFTQGLARGLCVLEDVTSPTFTILSEYHSGRLPLYHMDAYRLNHPEEAYDIGLEDLLNHQGVLVIEWAEQLASLLPPDHLSVHLTHHPEGRMMTMTDEGCSRILLRGEWQ